MTASRAPARSPLRRLQRAGPEIALALIVVLAAVSLWQAWDLVEHMRDEARQTSQIYGRVIAALGDPASEISQLLEIAGEPTQGTAGYVTALNMTTNKIDWQVEWPASVGACRSGVLSTAGGVVFAASWGDATRGSPTTSWCASACRRGASTRASSRQPTSCS